MFRLGSAAFALCLLFILSKTPACAAQDKPDEGTSEAAAPLLLVAHPKIGDPIFEESVVLTFPAPEGTRKGLVVGLMANRPARIALSKIFPDDEELKDRTETVFFGGPVGLRTPSVIFRSSKPVRLATLLFGDVYVSFDADLIKELLKKPEDTSDLRLFLGRSQWRPAQLQREVDLGAWYSLPAESNLIFGTSPQYLWHNLLEKADPSPVVKVLGPPAGLSANLAEPAACDRFLRGYWGALPLSSGFLLSVGRLRPEA